ncbi:hypothetical protein PGB90_008651 [Kerria lacca]
MLPAPSVELPTHLAASRFVFFKTLVNAFAKSTPLAEVHLTNSINRSWTHSLKT